MLAQNFKTATDLGLTEPQLSALQKTLVLLETGRLQHVDISDEGSLGDRAKSFTGHFNMDTWGYEMACGSVCCIGGTAELIGNVTFAGRGQKLDELFYPPKTAIKWESYNRITPCQAATALRSYLTTDNARWDLAVPK